MPVIALVALALQGCIPLPQLEQRKADLEFNANYDGGQKYVLFAIGDYTKPKTYQIVAARSFAVSPKGKRHAVRVVTHSFDVQEKFIFLRDDVVVLDDQGAAMTLRNGLWKFHLALDEKGKVSEHDFSFKLTPFYYIPLIHGAPN
jgi:hypothetical protein